MDSSLCVDEESPLCNPLYIVVCCTLLITLTLHNAMVFVTHSFFLLHVLGTLLNAVHMAYTNQPV